MLKVPSSAAPAHLPSHSCSLLAGMVRDARHPTRASWRPKPGKFDVSPWLAWSSPFVVVPGRGRKTRGDAAPECGVVLWALLVLGSAPRNTFPGLAFLPQTREFVGSHHPSFFLHPSGGAKNWFIGLLYAAWTDCCITG